MKVSNEKYNNKYWLKLYSDDSYCNIFFKKNGILLSKRTWSATGIIKKNLRSNSYKIIEKNNPFCTAPYIRNVNGGAAK